MTIPFLLENPIILISFHTYKFFILRQIFRWLGIFSILYMNRVYITHITKAIAEKHKLLYTSKTNTKSFKLKIYRDDYRYKRICFFKYQFVFVRCFLLLLFYLPLSIHLCSII